MVTTSTPQITCDLATLAIDLIDQAGCEYGDIRFCTYRNQILHANDHSLSHLTDHQKSGRNSQICSALG